jgi:hypothetical protein
MNDHHAIQRLRSVAPEITSAARWALPLACALALSTTLSAATERALVGKLEVVSAPPTSDVGAAPATDVRGIGSRAHWMRLAFVDADGRQSGLDCLTSENVRDSTMRFNDPEEMFRLAPEMCRDMRSLSSSLLPSED